MEFFSEYLVFLAKVITVVAGIAAIFAIIVSSGQRMRRMEKLGHIEVTSLNEKYKDMSNALMANVLSDTAYENFCKSEKKSEKLKAKQEKKNSKKAPDEQHPRPRVFVIGFEGDIRASACSNLSEQVTAVLMQATPNDEVVVLLESSGGMVHSYGLASAQLQRIRDKSIPLTVCVDKVAASGGYMMACIANQIFSAPFAVIGSIGVVAQIPNIHRLLKKHDIDFEMLTAGEFKRTLTVLGENTEKGRQKFQQEIQETHDLFKDFVVEHRPSIAIDTVATGEVWFGRNALKVGLVDAVCTSDEYLYRRHEEADLYKIDWIEKHSLVERIGLTAESSVERIILRILTKMNNQNNHIC